MGTFARYPRYKFNWRGFLPPGIKTLILVCTGVFVVQTIVNMFVPGGGLFLAQWFGLVPRAVTHGLRLWQPVTYIFLHGGLWHLLINMLMLWMFGRELEMVWGKNRFLNYFSSAEWAPGLSPSW